MLATVVRVLHVAFVAWFLWAPIFGDRETLVLHAVVAPFLMLHWVVMSDECALTRLEMYFRGVDHTESFVHAVVGPVYVITDAQARRVAWGVAVAAWAITLLRLGKLYSRQDTTTRLPPVAASHS